MEKYWMIKYFGDTNFLNKKSELINNCRQQNKNVLMNVKKVI